VEVAIGARFSVDGENVVSVVSRTGLATRRDSFEDATGDVADVARRAGVSVATVRSENHLSPGARLRAGQRLVVRRTVTATKRHRTRLAASQAGAGRNQNGGRTGR